MKRLEIPQPESGMASTIEKAVAIVDRIKNNEIQLIINTPSGRQSEYDDSYIRKAAVHYKIPYITTMTATLAMVKGIEAARKGKSMVKSLQDYHTGV